MMRYHEMTCFADGRTNTTFMFVIVSFHFIFYVYM